MRSFWETEDFRSESHLLHPDELYAEELFRKEHSRDSTGRYIVKYPFKSDSALGDSKNQAISRFRSLESKLTRNSELKKEYYSFMREYEDLNHMRCLGDLDSVKSNYIIPHFCVLNPTSTSTKLRVVFDASCPTTNGRSLNSIVYTGPKLQADINELIIKFRLNEVALSSDISKMFRMSLIHESQRPYQHILWRYSQEEPIQVFELNTISFGVASSPYLAIRVLHQLADDEGHRFPLASQVLKQGFFVDNLLYSVPTVEEAIQLQDEMIGLLQSGGFLLRKWSSNHLELLERIPADHCETPVTFNDDQNVSVKVLGLQWRPAEDVFSFTTTKPSLVATKRHVLSQIGRQFDPLGFAAPCILYAKSLMQQLWARNIGWDEPLPPQLEEDWSRYVAELPFLVNFSHERLSTISNHINRQVIGFCDASTVGYAAAVYLRTTNAKGEVKVSLLIAKSKVAPLKTLSIPRLELMAAHLLAKLIGYVKEIVTQQFEVQQTFLLTDSSVVLAWLNTPPCNLKTFVATRITKIIDCVPSECWFHVAGIHNMADLASRGALPSTLLSTPEWLKGPMWLYQTQDDWPIRSIYHFRSNEVPELKNLSLIQVSESVKVQPPNNYLYSIIQRFSSFYKLQRTLACCLHFINKCRKKLSQKNSSVISLSEISQAHDVLIKVVQTQHFTEEINLLTNNKECRNQSLRSLSPFIDTQGFLRVGGRLSHSSLPYTQKHPLLLQKNCHFTNLLIDYYHNIYLHVGPRTLQSLLTRKYWIMSARRQIRSRKSKCLKCFKVEPSKIQPLMGNLPTFRTQDIHAFHTVGVDMAGPFYTKESTRRNAKVSKSYLCIFVCFATRAVHLEVCSDLTTSCFFAAFDRFTARRGLCHTVISDNGKNFVSAARQLREIKNLFIQNKDIFQSNFIKREIKWSFQPSRASHFGGMFEAGVKSAKFILKRVTGDRSLTFEELCTLFARAESVLNSRPLGALSNDPSEFEVLTPGHFLIGRELLAVPESDLTNQPAQGLTRWRYVQSMSQQFWKLWRRDFLHTLQQKQKWTSKCQNIKQGDLVLVHADTEPLKWNLGRITETFPGTDGIIRAVKVRTKDGIYSRPVVKLSPLPLGDN